MPIKSMFSETTNNQFILTTIKPQGYLRCLFQKFLLLITATLCTSIFVPLKAQEGNYRLENFGNVSALLTGNVTASVSDLALTYYNPSRLPFMGDSKFLISIKAYQYEQFSYQNNFGPAEKMEDSDFNGIPSMLAGKFELSFLPDHIFAYSLISRHRTTRNLSYESGLMEDQAIGGMQNTAASLINIDLRTTIRDEWMGLSWAHKLEENFAVGATAFFSIYNYKETGDVLLAAQHENENVSMLNERISYKQSTYGLFFKLGASYLINDIELGANITLPHLKLFGNGSYLTQDLRSGLGNGNDLFHVYEEKDLNNRRKTSLGIALGAGIPFNKSKLHLSTEWYAPVGEYKRLVLSSAAPGNSQDMFREAYKSVLNFGLGADVFISPNTKLILSLSSDFNAHSNSINILEQLNQLEENSNLFGNIWHFGLGTDLNTRLGNIYTGLIYSRTSAHMEGERQGIATTFEEPTLPIIGKVNYQRVRLIVGIDLSVIEKTLEKKLEEQLERFTSPAK